jgi:hypothetical protein
MAGSLNLDATWKSEDDDDLYVQLKKSQNILKVCVVHLKYCFGFNKVNNNLYSVGTG